MGDQRETYPYGGKARQVIGRLHYPEAPEPGAIIGPNGMGDMCVVLGTESDGTLIGRAILSDITAAGMVSKDAVGQPRT